MALKRIILLIVAVVGLFLISETVRFKRWLEVFILTPRISDQMEHLGIEERREMRFGNLYSLCQYTKKTLDTTRFKNEKAVILLPPNDYIRAQGLEAFHFPEPIEFYYHTGGIRSVWTSSPNVEEANWTFVPQGKGSIALIHINKEELHKLLESYKKYKATL